MTTAKNSDELLLCEIKKSNIEASLKTIRSKNRLVIINTYQYDGDGKLFFATLSKVEKSKIVEINMFLPEYTLEESDIQWLLSLPNLQKFVFNVKKFPVSFIKGLKNLKKLRELACILDNTEKSSQLLLENIVDLSSLERLDMSNMQFSDTYNWRLPPKASIVQINFSSLTTNTIKILGQSAQVRHLAIFNSKFPPCTEIASKYFHSKLRCLAIYDKEFTKCILDSLEYFDELKMLFVRFTDNSYWQLIENKISNTKNVLRVFVVDNEIKNVLSDQMLKKLRSKYAIYADYGGNWLQYVLDYADSCYEKSSIVDKSKHSFIDGLYEINIRKKLNTKIQ
ncbi:MAG: hypothetical protein LBC74_08050 [Planctomycetaceae bacterium]|jgi:hypothetical protein|nr:hypothetical protein [Planctomycetaceae bacterium]